MIQGKTIFSWKTPAIANGDPRAFARAIFEGNFDGVLLKVADGAYEYRHSRLSAYGSYGANVNERVIAELQALGIDVHFWHFVYGVDPRGELAIANQLCQRYKPASYVWDAETAFDGKYNAVSNATMISGGLKDLQPDISQGLAWWALPFSPTTGSQWHPVKVADAFLNHVDVVMPMMYWQGKTPIEALKYLNDSLFVWKKVVEDFPMIPVGRAYNGDGGEVDPLAISFFAEKVFEMRSSVNFKGISWWSADVAFNNPTIWNAIKHTTRWNEFEIDPNKLPLEEVIFRLVNAHRPMFPEFYLPNE